MKYFKSKTVSGLKKEYRRLATENHPDHGGDAEVMKEINMEYDVAMAIASAFSEEEEDDRPYVTGADWYDNAWVIRKGYRYNEKLEPKDISKIIRTYCKEKFPMYKFSVRIDSYNAIYIRITGGYITAAKADNSGEADDVLDDVEAFARSYSFYQDNPYNEYASANVYIHVDRWIRGGAYKYDPSLKNKTCKFVA